MHSHTNTRDSPVSVATDRRGCDVATPVLTQVMTTKRCPGLKLIVGIHTSFTAYYWILVMLPDKKFKVYSIFFANFTLFYKLNAKICQSLLRTVEHQSYSAPNLNLQLFRWWIFGKQCSLASWSLILRNNTSTEQLKKKWYCSGWSWCAVEMWERKLFPALQKLKDKLQIINKKKTNLKMAFPSFLPPQKSTL